MILDGLFSFAHFKIVQNIRNYLRRHFKAIGFLPLVIFERLSQAGRSLGRTPHPTSRVTKRDEGSEARYEVSKMYYVLLSHDF